MLLQIFSLGEIYSRHKEGNCNTLPAPTNLNRTKFYMEAVVIAGTVSEIMAPDSTETVVTPMMVHLKAESVATLFSPLLSNGKQTALSTMPVFTESKKTLKELEIHTLEILSAASGYRYTEKENYTGLTEVTLDSVMQTKIKIVNLFLKSDSKIHCQNHVYWKRLRSTSNNLRRK